MIEDGINVLKKFIAICDESPGIYQMIGNDDEVLYIGKAKNLKSRLSDYLQIKNTSYKTQVVISSIVRIETIVTANEVEAILLESNLVRKIQPRYNILLKDDKSFPYILIDETSEYPRIVKYRGKKMLKGTYWGPFASAAKVEEVIAILQSAFLIRTCSDSFFESRKRPCILYQIKRCSGPCVAKVTKNEYQALVDQVKKYLKGSDSSLQKELTQVMNGASEKFEYEKAAIYRDRINALNSIRSKQVANLRNSDNFDVVVVDSAHDIAVVEIFFIRDGINLGNKVYYWNEVNLSTEDEILSAFLFNFYKNHMAPEEILVSHKILDDELLCEFLQQSNGKKIKVLLPTRGVKKDLLLFALNNAESSLRKQFSINEKHQLQFTEIQKFFGMAKKIHRIEIYDNSHFSGDQAVGVMVVCGRNGFNKPEYRKYNIKTLQHKSDDYEMFREVLIRRFKTLSNLPEFIIIDGGPGQVSAAYQTCQKLGLGDIVMIGMAKGLKRNSGEETIYTYDNKTIMLDKHSKLKQYLQVLRDEAHRFAISANRKKMEAKLIKSSLDKIPGIGPKKKLYLMKFFGSVEKIQQASLKDLLQVEFLNQENAENIYQYFHNSL